MNKRTIIRVGLIGVLLTAGCTSQNPDPFSAMNDPADEPIVAPDWEYRLSSTNYTDRAQCETLPPNLVYALGALPANAFIPEAYGYPNPIGFYLGSLLYEYGAVQLKEAIATPTTRMIQPARISVNAVAITRWFQPVHIYLDDDQDYRGFLEELLASLELPLEVTFVNSNDEANVRIVRAGSGMVEKCAWCSAQKTSDVIYDTGSPIPKKSGQNWFRKPIINVDGNPGFEIDFHDYLIFKPGLKALAYDFFHGIPDFYTKFVKSGYLFTPLDIISANVEGLVLLREDETIEEAYCLIYDPDLSVKDRKWVYSECLLRSLGALGFTNGCKNGILSRRIPGQGLGEFFGLSECDRNTLTELYVGEAVKTPLKCELIAKN